MGDVLAAPGFNFTVAPDVAGEDAYWGTKQRTRDQQPKQADAPDYSDIKMPRNTPAGFTCALFATKWASP